MSEYEYGTFLSKGSYDRTASQEFSVGTSPQVRISTGGGSTIYALEGSSEVGALEHGIGALLRNDSSPGKSPVPEGQDDFMPTMRAAMRIYDPVDTPSRRLPLLRIAARDSVKAKATQGIEPRFTVTEANVADVQSALKAEVAMGGLRGLFEKVMGRKKAAEGVLAKLAVTEATTT